MLQFPGKSPSIREVALLMGMSVLGALSMGFQLVAARLLGPYFGSSLTVWAWLIATFLAAFSFGSLVGAWAAQAQAGNDRFRIECVRWTGILSFCVSVAFGRTILNAVSDFSVGLPLACVLIFFLPSVALASFSPVAVGHLTRRNWNSGTASGVVLSCLSLGNIAGVLGTAFYLVPRFAVSELLVGWLVLVAVVLEVLLRLLKDDR